MFITVKVKDSSNIRWLNADHIKNMEISEGITQITMIDDEVIETRTRATDIAFEINTRPDRSGLPRSPVDIDAQRG